MQSKQPLKVSSLQRICIGVGRIKEELIEELPHHGHRALYFSNDEITTGILNNKTEIKIHLATGKLLYFDNEAGHYVDLLNDDVGGKLQSILSKAGVGIELERLENPAQEDLDTYRFFASHAKKILETVRMGLEGRFTQVHLWPHHFDFSVEWFAGDSGGQVGIGVSPGDEKHPMPYLYVNPWPFDEKVLEQRLPLGAWHTEEWKGIRVEWSEIVQYHPQEAASRVTDLFHIARRGF